MSTTTCDGDTQEGNKLTRIIPHILCIFQQVQISAHLDALNVLAQERTDDLISIIGMNSQNKSTRRQWTVYSYNDKYTINLNQGEKKKNHKCWPSIKKLDEKNPQRLTSRKNGSISNFQSDFNIL